MNQHNIIQQQPYLYHVVVLVVFHHQNRRYVIVVYIDVVVEVLLTIWHHLYLIKDNQDLVMLLHQLVFRNIIDLMNEIIQFQHEKRVDQQKVVVLIIMLVMHLNMNNLCRMWNNISPPPMFAIAILTCLNPPLCVLRLRFAYLMLENYLFETNFFIFIL
jgi:hypothetical protein